MKNRTCEDAADTIIRAGSGKGLIVNTLRSVFEHAYNRGYRAMGLDIKRATAAKKKALDTAFKKELDQIDDVRIAKWE